MWAERTSLHYLTTILGEERRENDRHPTFKRYLQKVDMQSGRLVLYFIVTIVVYLLTNGIIFYTLGYEQERI